MKYLTCDLFVSNARARSSSCMTTLLVLALFRYAYSKTGAANKTFPITAATAFVDATPAKPNGVYFNMVGADGRIVLQMKAPNAQEKRAWLARLSKIVDLVRTAPRFQPRRKVPEAQQQEDGRPKAAGSVSDDEDESVAVRRFVNFDTRFLELRAAYTKVHSQWSSLRSELYDHVAGLLRLPTWSRMHGTLCRAIAGPTPERLTLDLLDVFATNSVRDLLRCWHHGHEPRAQGNMSMLKFPKSLTSLWRMVSDARLPLGSVLWSWVCHLPTSTSHAQKLLAGRLGERGTPGSSLKGSAAVPFVPPEAVLAFIDHLTLTAAKLCKSGLNADELCPAVSEDDDLDPLAIALEKLAFCAGLRYFHSYRELACAPFLEKWVNQLEWLQSFSAAEFGIDEAFRPLQSPPPAHALLDESEGSQQLKGRFADTYATPVALLQMLDGAVAPVDVMNLIIQVISLTERAAGEAALEHHRLQNTAPSGAQDTGGSGTAEAQQPQRLSAEELFPIIAFVIVRAGLPRFPLLLSRALVFLMENGSPRLGGGRAHYCLITINGAFQWLCALRPATDGKKKFVVDEGPERAELIRMLEPMVPQETVDRHIRWLSQLFSA